MLSENFQRKSLHIYAGVIICQTAEENSPLHQQKQPELEKILLENIKIYENKNQNRVIESQIKCWFDWCINAEEVVILGEVM